jgi:hypothetical protein
MAGLVPAIHDFLFATKANKTWMPGMTPGMTARLIYRGEQNVAITPLAA